MFLQRTERKKNGKTHSYWNVVENKRLDDGRVVHRHLLYLGEINSSQAEGRYLLRTNLTDNDPAQLWQYYIQLVAVEEAFRNLKGDLAIRPVFHQDEKRIEAHIFTSSSRSWLIACRSR